VAFAAAMAPRSMGLSSKRISPQKPHMIELSLVV
jgi:hypothetical protein